MFSNIIATVAKTFDQQFLNGQELPIEQLSSNGYVFNFALVLQVVEKRAKFWSHSVLAHRRTDK